MKRTPALLGILLLLIAAAAAANTAPTITAASPITLNAGDPATSVMIATVSDAEDSAGSLTVTTTSVPNGITVASITNTNGSINALITAACTISGENDIGLQVTDSGGLTATATFVVFVRSTLPPPIPTISATTNGTGTQDQACPEEPLTLTASSFGATSYQWYVNGSPISGATSVSYSATSAGSYTVSASNDCYTSDQSFIAYNVSNPTPHQPFVSANGSTSFCSGGSVTLTSDSATGIQWYINGVAIPGANNESYTATASGSYTCILDALGCHSTASDPIVVTVSAAPSAPTITAGTNGTGTNDQACPEEPLTLVAHDTNSSLTNYQWYNDNNAIDGATSNQYVATGSGDYFIVATLNGCSTSSAAYTVQNPTPHSPFISFRNQDSSVSTLEICGGSQIIDSDSATGIQWYKDGVAIPGAGSQSYTATQSGVYTAQLDALGCHSQFGRNVTLIVDATPSTPTITGETNGTGTQDQACPEEPLTLDASSTGATSYQWYSDNAPISGATTSQLVVTAFGNYSVYAINGICSVQSATYTVQNPTPHSPFISFRNQDSSVTTLEICGGSQIIDSDSATGIQWYKDGVAIPGAGSQSYTATQSGVYTAQLDALGCHSQFGRDVTLIVDALPTTPTISGDTNGTGTQDQACPEEPLTLHANGATGAQSYTWYSDNAVIPNETTDTLVMTGIGNISVTATNGTCTTAHSATYVVQNPTPHSPFISFRNQDSSVTTLEICGGTTQIIDSDSATGIQWYKDGVAIPGAGSQSYTATQSGVYTAQLDALGCYSQFGRNVTLIVDATPTTPTITGETNGTGTQDQACPEEPLTLDASSTGATSYQWYSDNAPISGATTSQLVVTAAGNYSVFAINGVCSVQSATYTVQNPTPHSPFISILSGSANFCQGGSVTLFSDSATGIQWYKDGVAIPGANSESYVATASGSYTAQLDALGCHSQFGNSVTITVFSYPSTPTITAGGATTFCSGGSVTLTSSSASDNQWYLNGTAISGATAQSYTAAASGSYTVAVTTNGCSSTSAATTVTVNANPSAAITAPSVVISNSAGNGASVASAGTGATYNWSISGGTIASGAGTNAITFNAGSAGTLTLSVSVTNSNGCSDAKSASVSVVDPVTVSNVNPSSGSSSGGTSVTIKGINFLSGATVTFGGTPATNVVVVSSTQITATTPAHAEGSVDIVVTNANTASGTLSSGFRYKKK